MDKIKSWIKNNKKEFWILAFILAVGAFCRLYNIAGYMTFLGDEGRDVIIVRRLLVEGHPPLIGPGTSIGNMYLGPFYYYMMAPALFLANFSPVGPAIQIAILGIVTIWFVWFVGREWFGSIAGLVAAGLYAISPTVIIYSRSSWNPNIMPFFALLSIYSIWKVYKEHKFNWLLILGFSFAAVIQSHYLGLILIPTIGIFWLLSKKDKKFWLYSLYSFTIFLVMMSPLFFFDLRHNWINSKAMYEFFTVRQTTVSIKPWAAIPNLYPQFSLIIERLVAGQNVLMGGIIAAIIITTIICIIIVNRKNLKKLGSPHWLLASWIGFGVIGLGLYKQHIYDHYYGFLFPAIFLLTGFLIAKLNKYLLFMVVGFLVVINLWNNPLRFSPNNQMQRAYDVAKKIETVNAGQQFNLGVIATQNYEGGYKYFLLKDRQPVVDIDSQVKDSITNQLFVVCELDKNKCDPTHNSSAAVANFGWSKVENQWEVDGVILYKLIHTK